MWSLFLRSLTLMKGALVVGVAVSAVVTSPVVANSMRHDPVPSASPSVVAEASPTPPPAGSPSSHEKPKPSASPLATGSDRSHDELVKSLIKECAEKYAALRAAGDTATQGERESTEQVCKHAFAESGLSSEEFAKLFSAVVGGPTKTERPSDKSHDELVKGLIKECAEKYLALKAAGDNATQGQRESTEQVCHHAFAESGLSFEEYAKLIGAVIATLGTTDRPATDNLRTLIEECVRQYKAHTADASDACRKAIEASGLTTKEFWTKFGPTASVTPAPVVTDELRALVKDCFDKYAAGDKGAYEACKKAIAASGMTGDQFFATFGKPTPPAKTSAPPKPSERTPPPVTDELRALVKDCFDKYTARDPGVGDACRKSIEASGMTTEQFFATFGKPTPPAKTEPSSTPKPSASVGPITICLLLTKALTSTSSQEQIQAAIDACAKAMALTGLSSADFWAKFGATH